MRAPIAPDAKAWLKAVAAYLNLSLSDLAINSGLAASTLTRYVNDKSNVLSVTDRTLEAIARYSGIPKNVMPGQRRLPGFGEPEAEPYDSRVGERLPEWVEKAISAHRGGTNHISAWIMHGWALDMLGVLPGDVLMIDQNRRAKTGDIVCAQVTDLGTGHTETVMRLYQKPMIVAFSSKLGPIRPEVVDDERVVIMGVETGIIRPRH